MTVIGSFLSLIFVLSPFSPAFSRTHSSLYNNLGCNDRPRYCRLITQRAHARTHRRVIRPVSNKAKALVTHLAPKIFEVSEQFSINPLSVAAIYATEETVLINSRDKILDQLVWLTGWSSFWGRQISLGQGQIILPLATNALEPLVAEVQDRPLRNRQEVIEALLDLEESVFYTAAYVKVITEAYDQEGFDLEDRPEIVGTLYSLGYPERRAMEARLEEREPQVNFYGLFIETNLDDIEAALFAAD